MSRLFLFFFLAGCMCAQAQSIPERKCSPSLKNAAKAWRSQPDYRRSKLQASVLLTLVVQDLSAFEDWAGQCALPVLASYPPANVIVLRDRFPHFFDTTLVRPDVLFADFGHLDAPEELPVPGHNLFANNIRFVHARQPALDGAGCTVSIKEFRFDSSDVDFKNRFLPTARSAPFLTTHASIMASLAAGAGTSDPAGRGVARGSRLVSSSFAGLLPDADADYEMFDISVQNHSYGLDIENYYGAGALAYDRSTMEHPYLLHVFSAGNLGEETPGDGKYANVNGFANLSGNFKMAKNALVVGSVDSFGNVMFFSSRGPAYDGRVKPELVAFGQDGSSGAAALVSGAAAVTRQAFFEKYGFYPTSDLLRAILINTADETGLPGPDFLSGYGNLNLKKAVGLVQYGLTADGEVAEGDSVVFTVPLPPNIHKLRITLCWNDVPAMPGADVSLVNDLDLTVQTPDGALRYPWVLDASPHRDSLSLPARKGRDSLNTVEQVGIDAPAPGVCRIIVSGQAVPVGPQAFALAILWDTLGHFEWTSPVRGDPAAAGREAVLRWETTFNSEIGKLEWAPAGSNSWRSIDPEAPLEAGFRRWLVPDTFAAARVRMRVAGYDFVSDTFLIAETLRLRVAFNCPDSVLLQWAAIHPAATYRIWGLGERYLEPLLTTADTAIVLQKNAHPQQRFAVSAMLSDARAEGPASGAPDISDQGAGCYINTFFALLDEEDQVDLTLEMGTLFRVQKVFFEKLQNGNWQVVHEETPAELRVVSTDPMPSPGVNTYRARLELESGASLTSDSVELYYAGAAGYIVLPNPLFPGQAFRVLAHRPEDAPRFYLFDAPGRLILEKTLEDTQTDLVLPALPPGFYAWVVVNVSGERLAGGKLLVSP